MDKYSIEVIEMICEGETDGNAQVTSPTKVIEEFPQEENEQESVAPIVFQRGSYQRGVKCLMQTNTATNWLLFGIFCLLFMFMIFKCD